jgi:hypothetical protein
MQSLALKKSDSVVVPLSKVFEQVLIKARVHAKTEQTYTLKPENGVMMVAMRAASCLLQPEVGDQVLMCCIDPGEYFILAVLVQANVSQSQISVVGDLILQSTEGSVTLNAKQDLNTESARWNALHDELIYQGVSEARTLDERYSLTTKIHHETATEVRLSESKVHLNRAREMGISAEKVMINS